MFLCSTTCVDFLPYIALIAYFEIIDIPCLCFRPGIHQASIIYSAVARGRDELSETGKAAMSPDHLAAAARYFEVCSGNAYETRASSSSGGAVL